MLPVALAALAATMWGTGDFVGGVLTKRIPVLVVSTIAWAAGLVTLGILALAFDPALPPAHAVAWGLVGGLVGAIGLGSLYQGLALGRMGVVAPIAATSVLVPVVVGFARGDRPAPWQAVGMVLAIVGAILAAIAPDPQHGRRGVGRGLLFAVLAAVFIGFAMVCLAEAAKGGAIWSAMLFRISSTPLVLLAALLTHASFRAAGRRDIGLLIAVGAADNGANVLFALATTLGLLTLVSVIASLVPVVTAFWARFLLHERLTRHQLVGVALALLGIVLIAAG